MVYIEKMLFEFAKKLNNYRRFKSDEDVYNIIDKFLTEYKSYDQPERSKREDMEGPNHISDKGWPDKNAGFP